MGSLSYSLGAVLAGAAVSTVLTPLLLREIPAWRALGTPEAVDSVVSATLGVFLCLALAFIACAIRAPFGIATDAVQKAQDEAELLRIELAELRASVSPADPMERLRQAAFGTPDVVDADVRAVVKRGQLDELMGVMRRSPSNVKKRQTAVTLVDLALLDEALELALAIYNGAESFRVAQAVIYQMTPSTRENSPEWNFLFGIYDHLKDAQRGYVLDLLAKAGIQPRGVWRTYSGGRAG